LETEALPVRKPKWRWVPPELRVALRMFVVVLMVVSVIDRLTHTWDRVEQVSNPADLHPEYAQQIDIETYLMTREQLKQLALPQEGLFVYWEQEQTGILNDPAPLFFVIRLRNRSDSYIWGRLKAHSERWDRGLGIDRREILVSVLAPKMEDFKIMILATSSDIRAFDYTDYYKKESPAITMQWISLYASKDGNDG